MSKVHAVTIKAAIDALVSGLAPLNIPPAQSLSEWASEHFVLSAEGSHVQGGWEAYPFQPGWMDAFSNDEIEEVTVKKSKRVGYTKTLLAFIAYNAAHRRRKQALWQPTDDDRDSFAKTEIEPMLRDVAALKAVWRKGAADTMSLKRFLGSVLHLLGGKATTSFRRITLAVAMLDELDGFDQQIEKSADPVTLARGRLEGAPFPKLIGGSTPRVKGKSHVEHRESQAGAIMRYSVLCPSCDVEHPLLWGGKAFDHGFKWDADEPSTVRHVCPHCRAEMRQEDYLQVWANGRWVDRAGLFTYGTEWRDALDQPCPPPRHVAFQIWAAYSPQRAWPDIVREFVEANVKARAGDFGPLQGFVNETLGETWEEGSDAADGEELRKRAGDFPMRVVQRGMFVCTLGVDTQGDRIEAFVWAWGRGLERQLVDRQIYYGDPNVAESEPGSVWAQLTEYRRTALTHAGGGFSPILAGFIDSGGHATQAVYNYCRGHQYEHMYAIKGMSTDHQPILGKPNDMDVTWRGARIKRGVKLWPIGTDTAKFEIYGRMKVSEPGPGYVHLSKHMPDDMFDGLTSEKLVTRYVNGRPRTQWVKAPGVRNEPLDGAVYALAAAYYLGIDRWTEGDWRKWELRVNPPKAEPEAAEPEEVIVPVPVQKRRVPRTRGRLTSRMRP